MSKRPPAAADSDGCCTSCADSVASCNSSPRLGDYLPWLRPALPAAMGGTKEKDEVHADAIRSLGIESSLAALPWLTVPGGGWRDRVPGVPTEWATMFEAEEAHADATSGAPTRGPALRYGVNTVKVFQGNDYATDPATCASTTPDSPASGSDPADCYVAEYGTAQQIIADLRQLGATLARHPNVVDFLAPSFDWPTPGVIPLWSARVVATNFNVSQVFTRLEYLRVHATSATPRVRFAFMFLSAGGGNDSPDSSSWSAAARDHAGVSSPTGLGWDAAHVGASIGTDSFNTVFGSDWDTNTLDPSNPYKRAYYAYIAQALRENWTRCQG